jgi:thioredoxin-related protein
VVRVNLMSSMGMELARRYGVRASPTLLVFDGEGEVVYSQAGLPSMPAIVGLVADLASG